MKHMAALSLLIGLLALPAFAQQHAGWDGTWIGNWQNGDGTQIVFAGDELVAFYWNGDYQDAQAIQSADHKAMTISWSQGKATLTLDGEAAAHIVIEEAGKPDLTFPVKRDSQ
jgi:hypothetical protein